MKTLSNLITVEQAVKLAKPFVGSLAKGAMSRPILKTAHITEEHVIVTDSHILIRIAHDSNATPGLHHYAKEHTGHLDASSYPQTARLVPDKDAALGKYVLPVKEWIDIHEMAAPSANEHKNSLVTLKGDTIHVDPVVSREIKRGNKIHTEAVPLTEQLSYTYTLDAEMDVDVSYNNKYMLMALKAINKTKAPEVELYYYGSLRPMLLVAPDLEIIILPIRKY